MIKNVLVHFLISFSRSIDGIPNLNAPCAKPLPPRVLRVTLKDWKNGEHFLKWGKASIFLATTTAISSFELETVHSNIRNPGMHHQASDEGAYHDKNGHVGELGRPGPSDTVRLISRSPWPSIVIELLSGEHIHPGDSWIYPFKLILAYDKQIRKFVELLDKVDVDTVEAKNLSHILHRILMEVVHLLGPKRHDVEYSDTYVSNVLQKAEALSNHNAKVKKSSPEYLEFDMEYDSEAEAEAEAGLSSTSPIDDLKSKVSEPSNLASEATPVPHYKCTCLRDARDHLQVFLSAIDWHLGSLLKLRKAIRDRAIAKIRFEHLWHLFQPGDLVVTSRQPCQAYRVIHISGGRPLLVTADIASRDSNAEGRPTFH